MLWNLFVIEREKLKSARQSKSYVKVPPPPFLRRRRQKDKGRREKFLLEIAAYSATRETSEDENRARLDVKTSNLRVYFVASFFFLSLARLLLFTSIARFSIERKKTSCFTTTRRTNHAEHNSKTCVSRRKKKRSRTLKARKRNRTVRKSARQ